MFDAIERSRFLARPVHLFIFRRQNVSLRFAGGTRHVDVSEHRYHAAQIERSEIKQTVERAKDKIKIKMAHLLDPAAPEYPVTQPLGAWWRPFIPSDPIHVTCLATHYGATDPPIVEWMGWATQPVYTDVELELNCDPNPPAGDAHNQGAKWQKGCWKAVYSTGLRGCNLDPEPLLLTTELAGVNGLILTAPAFADAPLSLAGGTLTWERANGIVEERPIMRHNGSSIEILYGGLELAIGLEVAALPGCAQTWAACAARRPDPQNHYGGAIYKPARDPYNGVSMSWG